MSIHSGHRQRMRQRFLKNGLEGLNDHEILELLLYYCIPRQDTNPYAHRLIERFGSLTGVLRAQEKELMEVEGIGENTAFYLNLLMETIRHYQIKSYNDLPEQEQILNSVESCGEYLRPYFEKQANEVISLKSQLECAFRIRQMQQDLNE